LVQERGDMLIGWKAWVATQYGFTRYNSLQHTWEDLPEDGILAVRTYESKGFRFAGADYYFMAPGPNDVIFGIDYDRRDADVREEILKRYPGAVVRRGKWTDVETFDLVNNEMQAAEQWP